MGSASSSSCSGRRPKPPSAAGAAAAAAAAAPLAALTLRRQPLAASLQVVLPLASAGISGETTSCSTASWCGLWRISLKPVVYLEDVPEYLHQAHTGKNHIKSQALYDYVSQQCSREGLS